jgi:hypothetical protein
MTSCKSPSGPSFRTTTAEQAHHEAVLQYQQQWGQQVLEMPISGGEDVELDRFGERCWNPWV